MARRPETDILSPDHPFLAKYQAALTEFLKVNLAKVDAEVKSLRTSVKAKEAEYTQDLGVKLYEAKKSFDQRRDKLADISSKVSNAVEARRLKTSTAEALKSEIVRAASVVNENRKLAEELADEAARLASDEKVLAALRRDVDLQMDVLRNVVQKTEKDLESNEEAKQRQDLFVERLTLEVEKIERKKARANEKCAEASARKSELENEARTIASLVEEAKKEVASAEAGWRKAVSVASSRHENYTKLVDRLTELRGEIAATQTAIQATRRQVAKEIEEHERLSGLKLEADARIARIVPALSAIAQELSEIRAESSEKLSFSSGLQSSMEEEVSHGSSLLSRREALFASVAKLKARKEEVEKAILANLKASEAGKANAKYLNRLKSELKDATRTLELQAAELENAIASNDLAKAAVQTEIDSFKQALDMLNEDLLRQNGILKRTVRDMKAQEALLAKKHDKVDVLSTKLAGLTGAIDLHKDLEEGEGIRRQIAALKEEVKEAQREATTLNRVWLKFQHELLETASKQSKAEAEVQVLNDRASLLEEKSARLALKMDTETRDLYVAKKLIRDLRNAVTQLTHEMTTQVEARELFEREIVLKRAEHKAREKSLTEQISETNLVFQEILEAIAELKRDIAEADTFSAAWERKYQLCKDFKDVANQEDHGNGEMAVKKAELNRLQHEHAALIQQQEQLAQKLEKCVYRRQNLCDQATAGKRKPPPQSVTAVAKRRVKELQAAAVEMKKKAKTAGQQVSNFKLKYEKFVQEAATVSTEADNSESAVTALKREVAAKQFEVYVNKEQLLSAHDVVKWMEAAKRGKYVFVVKTGDSDKRKEVMREQEVQRASLKAVLKTVGTKHDHETVAEVEAVFAAD